MTLTQRSTEWRQLRCGDVTASRLKDIKRPQSKKDGYELSTGELIGATAFGYLDELLAELITGKPQDRFRSQATDHGNEWEEVHREAACLVLRERFGEELILPEGEYAYVHHQTEPNIGCSPDYVVGGNRGGELKCPWSQAKHMGYIRQGLQRFLDADAKANTFQVQGSMWMAGWESYYVSSYHPDFPEDLQLVLWEVERDDDFIRKHEPRWLGFRDLVLAEYRRLVGGPF